MTEIGAAGTWPGYREALDRARERSGVDESVTCAVETFDGGEAVVARLAFDFMGGSMGVAHGDRIIAGVEEAIRRRVPFVSVIRSGGARTHEGFDALIQMRRTVDAMTRAREAAIPLIAWFRNPTTGGVHASYGAAADLIVAERGATVGFAGPRVVEALAGTELDGSSHTAEAYAAAGLVDALADDEEHATRIVSQWIGLVSASAGGATVERPEPAESEIVLSGWSAIEAARSERPDVREILARVADDASELGGDRTGSNDRCVVAAVARVAGERVMVIGTDRSASGAAGRVGAPAASGFRKARRAVTLAARWGIPVVSLVDTRGADPVPASDSAGLAAAISELMSTLSAAPVPTLAVVTGEGGSGGAMAFAAADRLVMQDDAVFEVIAPEGAASILYKDPSRAQEVAELMQLGAASLRARGYSDRTLPGPTTHGVDVALGALRDEIAAFLLDARTASA